MCKNSSKLWLALSTWHHQYLKLVLFAVLCCCVCKVSLFIALAWPLIIALHCTAHGSHCMCARSARGSPANGCIYTYYNNTLLVLCVLAIYYMDCQQLPFPRPRALNGDSVKCVNIIIKSGVQYHCSPIFQFLLKLTLEISDSAWYNAVWWIGWSSWGDQW